MTREEYEYNLELSHHGIKGQKWGVRRFQDELGRLTALGKKRKAEDFNKAKKKALDSGDSAFAKKNFDKLTDAEITKITNRFDLKMRLNSTEARNKAERAERFMRTTSNILQSTESSARSAISTYNSVAKVLNTFFDAELKEIQTPKKKNNNNNNNQNNKDDD